MEKNWKTNPLKGKKIVITREKEQAREFADLIEKRGGIPVIFPTISFRRLHSKKTETIIKNLEGFDWIIFTSANGVKFFFETLEEHNISLPENLKVAVIGPGTLKKLKTYGIDADLIPDSFIAEGIIEKLKHIKEKNFLIPRAKVARDTLPDSLKKMGKNVTVLEIYETVCETATATLTDKLKEADIITFTSPSTVENFVKIVKEAHKLCSEKITASIGPVTTKKAKNLNIKIDITASTHSLEGLLDAIESFLKAGRA